MKNKKVWIIIGVVLLLILLINPIAAYILERYVNNSLNKLEAYSGSVEDVDVHLWRGAYKVDGITIVKKDQESLTPFLEIESIDLSIHWQAIFRGRIVGEIVIREPVVNFVAGTEEYEAQAGTGEDWTQTVKDLMPIEVNRFEVVDGNISFKDFGQSPPIDIAVQDLDLVALNLSNVQNESDTLPASLTASGTSVGEGRLNVDMRMNVLKQIPDFDINFKFEDIHLVDLNDFIKAYGKFDVEKGTLSIYSEIAMQNGDLTGYVKPVLTDVKVINWDKESGGFFKKLKETVIGGVKEILENQPKEQVASKVPIQGHFSDTDADIWTSIANILKNAFVEAFTKELDRTISMEDVN